MSKNRKKASKSAQTQQSFFRLNASKKWIIGLVVVVVATGGILYTLQYRKSAVYKQNYRADFAKSTVESYAKNTVIRSIEVLVAEIKKFNDAANLFLNKPSEENRTALLSGYHSSLALWNRTAALQHGPATQYDYHKQLAAWACDRVLVDHILKQMANGELQLTERYLREEVVANVRGFWTARYLLYRDGEPRNASDFSNEERQYLSAITEAMVIESTDFEAAWRGTGDLTSEKRVLLKKAGLAERSSYAYEFSNPGTPTGRFASLSTSLQDLLMDASAAVEEIIPAVESYYTVEEKSNERASFSPCFTSIFSEVSDKKEYWVSVDAGSDILNIFKSAENVYLGGVEGSRGQSIQELVNIYDPALARLIKISFAHSSLRVKQVVEAADKTDEDKDLSIRRAVAELEKLVARLGVAIPQIVMDPAVEPFAAYIK